ncbi:aminotransferase class V-fold PLP-dependent enzyme [Vulgatibacter sp.]|uniref:aminotransferase class V-fold PLP-dependent enzyme n=1 Tax=Vulgatibacter sp. TaxID=1971226 RepID=UPI0035644292
MSLAALRAEFPILERTVYLNSNSTGAFPRGMDAVLARYAETLRDWRDEHWEGWWRELQRYHAGLEELLGAAPGTVVTDGSVSTLLGRVASCFSYEGARRRVITTDLEFPTVPFIWESFRRYGAEPEVVATGEEPEAAIEAVLDERVLAVCVTHASFRTGRLLDLRRIVRAARRVGALVIVDAYQTVGALPVDVRDLQPDFLLGGAHKWLCGAVESAFLYVRPELLPTLEPAATGWMAGSDPFSFETPRGRAPSALRFAAGTPAVLPAMLSRVGLDLVRSAGSEAIRDHSLRLTGRILEWADAAGIESPTPRAPAQRGGIVALHFAGDRQAAAALVREGFVCSWRGALRVAPHFYNTAEEVERFLAALARVRREAA